MQGPENASEWVDWIEEAIEKEYFIYYEYKYFSNIQKIGSGGFGNVYRANWKDSEQYLALKSFINFDDVTIKEIIQELKLQRNIHFHNNIITFYGISKLESDQYLLVMEYADSGTLQNYLKKNFNRLTWDDKYKLAYQLACAVSCLHNDDIVHRDLHSSNVLVNQDTIKLADFGLSKRIEVSSNKQSKLFGIIPYIDPKKFSGQRKNKNSTQIYSFTKKSDIYSVGILLWEISSGHPPFEGEQYDVDLAIEICQGLREEPIPNTPKDYIKVYTECWDGEPDNRPTINQVMERLKAKINIITENDQIGLNSQLSDTQEINNSANPKFSSTLHRELLKNIQNIEMVPTKTLTNKQIINENISSEKDLGIVINGIVTLVTNEETDRLRKSIFDYFNSHNINSQEIYNWILNNQNDSDSIFLLGLFNFFGIETNKNGEKAFNLFINASEQNHILAQYYAGICYSFGYGIIKNEKLAFKYYEKAANLGNSMAQNNLAFMYENGEGVDKDYNKAFELYQKAANLGDSDAQNNLANMYFNGKGVDKDYSKAFELFQKAANLENSLAQNNLANMYFSGKGIGKDYSKAFELYQQAANLGNSDAQGSLALMYENGNGTKKNISQAIYWYKQSVRQGNKDAQNKLEELNNINRGLSMYGFNKFTIVLIAFCSSMAAFIVIMSYFIDEDWVTLNIVFSILSVLIASIFTPLFLYVINGFSKPKIVVLAVFTWALIMISITIFVWSNLSPNHPNMPK